MNEFTVAPTSLPTISPSAAPTVLTPSRSPTLGPTVNCEIHKKRKFCVEESDCVWLKDDGSCSSCGVIEEKKSCRGAGCTWDRTEKECFIPTPSPTITPTPAPTLDCGSISTKAECRATNGCFFYQDTLCVPCALISIEESCRQAMCIWKADENLCF